MPFNSCPCDLPTALGSFTAGCGFVMTDIYKIGFRRPGQSAATDVATFTSAAYWTPLLAAVDDTKVVFVPVTYEGGIEAGDPINESGHDGVDEVLGYNNSRLVGEWRNISGAQRAVIKSWGCEELDFILVDSSGKIIAKANGTAPTFLNTGGKLAVGGFGKALNASVKTNFSIPLGADWETDVAAFTPTDFNARTFLVNP